MLAFLTTQAQVHCQKEHCIVKEIQHMLSFLLSQNKAQEQVHRHTTTLHHEGKHKHIAKNNIAL